VYYGAIAGLMLSLVLGLALRASHRAGANGTFAVGPTLILGALIVMVAGGLASLGTG
jgi:hypothetical protein